MLPRRTLLLAFVALAAAAVVLLAFPASGQTQDKGTAGDGKCLSCHAAEGMKYAAVTMPKISQIPRGQEFEVTATVTNPWKHHLEDVAMSLNLSNAPGVSFVGGEAPVESTFDGAIPPDSSEEHAFSVTSNTTEVFVSVVPEGDARPTTWVLRVVGPNRPWNSTDPGQTNFDQAGYAAVRLGTNELLVGGPGEWKAVVDRIIPKPPRVLAVDVPPASGLPDALAQPYSGFVGVYGNVTGVNEIYVQSPGGRLDIGESASFTFRLAASADVTEARILHKVRMLAIADVPQDHPAGHPPDMQDIGLWIEWATLPPVQGGDAYLAEEGGPVVIESGEVFSLMRAWAYAVGFGSSFLVIPSLVLGGTFGKASVAWLNKVSLGARRRVLWHNAASFGLLAFSLGHTLLFLLEPAKFWTIGMLWGGAALACLVMLAVTGAMQRSFVEKWGFATWRYMHWGIAFLMTAFILLHMGLDGTHFKFVRDMF